MTDSPNTKVVLKQSVLHGSSRAERLQRVAAVYIGAREYIVSAPSGAEGDALDWVSHFLVRQRIDLNSEVDVGEPLRGDALKAVKSELERQRRDANRPQGVTPDGLHYDAQICLNGHVLHSAGPPFELNDYCTTCGARSIDECPHCKEPIRGIPLNKRGASYILPQFCHKCGRPYPWMEDRIRTAHDLIEHDEKLSPEDRQKLWADLQFIMADPKADLAPAKRKLNEIRLEKATKYVKEFILDLTAKTLAEVIKG